MAPTFKPADTQEKKKRGARKKAAVTEQKLEPTLWAAADKLRGNMDAAEYKHVALGLIFLKYISDAFEEFRSKLKQDIENPESELYVSKPDDRLATLEDRDEYVAANIFWVPKEARWQHLLANAKQPTIGKTLDDAMIAIERDNPSLKGVLPKDYARPALDKQRLGEVIDLIGNIDFLPSSYAPPPPTPPSKVEGRKKGEREGRAQPGDSLPSPLGRGAGGEGAESSEPEGLQGGTDAVNDSLPSPSGRGVGGEGAQFGGAQHEPDVPASKKGDVLGRVYEYFLAQFASAEGKKGGQFYTPRPVVQLLVEMLAPYKGRVFDPCCGSGGMFVQSVKFVKAHTTGNGNGGKAKGDISIYGQESNNTTWRLAKMNLAIRGIEANIVWNEQGSFHGDAFKDLRADFVLANPPFNDSDWGGERLREDVRWKYGVPPAGNANFAWVQHFIHHLAPTGIAGFVLANGSMSSNQSGEGEIRKAIIEADLVDCMVALPGQLFYSTQIAVCLWFVTRNKKNGRFCDRHGETLFIDARRMGSMLDRVHRELTDNDIAKVAGTYHAWRGDKGAGEYADVSGFCKAAKLDDIRKHGHALTPGRYVGAEAGEDDCEPFKEKMWRLATTLREQQAEGAKLDAAIAANLKELGYGR